MLPAVASTRALVAEFLLVVFSQVLYYRNLYPPESFSKANAFNQAVYVSRHPGVTRYLETIVTNCLAKTALGMVERVMLVVYGIHHEGAHLTALEVPFERVVVDLSEYQGGDLEASLGDLFLQFRACLAILVGRLKGSGPPRVGTTTGLGVTFKILLEASKGVGGDPDWILREEPHQRLASALEAERVEVVPIREICVGGVRLGVLMERAHSG